MSTYASTFDKPTTALLTERRYDDAMALLRCAYKQNLPDNSVSPDLKRSTSSRVPSLFSSCLNFFKNSMETEHMSLVFSLMSKGDKHLRCDRNNSGPSNQEEVSCPSRNMESPSVCKIIQRGRSAPISEKHKIFTLARFLCIIRDEVLCGFPFHASCTLDNTMHLKFIKCLLKCGVMDSYFVHKTNKSQCCKLIQLAIRYLSYRWMAENFDFSLTEEQVRKNPAVFDKFPLDYPYFQSNLVLDENFKQKLAEGAYDIAGRSVELSKLSFKHMADDCLRMLLNIREVCPDTFHASYKNMTVCDLFVMCRDMEGLAQFGEARVLNPVVNITEERNFFWGFSGLDLDQQELVADIVSRCNVTVSRDSSAAYAQSRDGEAIVKFEYSHFKLLQACLNSSTSPTNDMIEILGYATYPSMLFQPFLVPALWLYYHKHAETSEHLASMVFLIERTLKNLVVPFFRICDQETFQYTHGYIMREMKNSPFCYAIDDCDTKNKKNLVRNVLGRNLSLQKLCVQQIFQTAVASKKIFNFRTRFNAKLKASDTLNKLVFPIGVKQGVSINGEPIPASKEVSRCDDPECENTENFCASCLTVEKELFRDMVDNVCSALRIPPRFRPTFAMEFLKYEIIAQFAVTSFRPHKMEISNEEAESLVKSFMRMQNSKSHILRKTAASKRKHEVDDAYDSSDEESLPEPRPRNRSQRDLFLPHWSETPRPRSSFPSRRITPRTPLGDRGMLTNLVRYQLQRRV